MRGVQSEKINVIYNWCDAEVLQRKTLALPVEFPDTSHFRVVFAGNMGKAQGLEACIGSSSAGCTYASTRVVRIRRQRS